jgi:membrane-bound lytic murein transglycosylase F
LRLTLVLILISFLAACSKPLPILEQIKKDGELVVLTRNSSTTYYEGPNGPTGFEYDLAKMFADYLGVRLKVVVPEHFSDIIPMIMHGDAHFAAAGLTVTPEREKWVRFGPPYQEITEQVVYNKRDTKPETVDDLGFGITEVLAGSSHAARLKELQKTHPELTWSETSDLESEELLSLVIEEVIDYTIADSNEVTLNQRFYPELQVAFEISPPLKLAWAFSYSHDYSLHDAANEFFRKIKKNGELESLVARYYSHVNNLNFASRRIFLRHVKRRLPEFQGTFQQAASENDIDWRLLAAMGYQESHWNPSAISPTGVRGIMMLTTITAKDLGIKKRTNVEQSIFGGAQYFAMLRNSIPKQIKEPDRTWFALAAYNVGLGHVMDARKITKKKNQNPNKWLHLKENLPLLRKKKWYSKTEHGYARGDEAVRYVENIRSYYDQLVWYTDQEEAENEDKKFTLDIDSPVL